MNARTRWTSVDPAQVGRVLVAVTRELSERFPELPAEDVSTVVRHAMIDFISTANVPAELAVLVRRRATARLLATQPQPVLTPYQSR